MTNWEEIQADWDGVHYLFQEQWPQIPAEEVASTRGDRGDLIRLVQLHTGLAPAEAESAVDEWAKRMTYAHDSPSAQWNMLVGHWTSFKGAFRERWAAFTDDEVARMEGRRAQIVGALQQKFGWSLEEAEHHADDWARRIAIDR